MLRFLIAAAFALSFNVTALAQSNSKKIADHIASSAHDGSFLGVVDTFADLPLTARENILGPFDNTNTQDIGNVGGDPIRTAGGFSFPFDVQVKELTAWHYNSNAAALPWGWRVFAQTKVEDSTARTNIDLGRECVGDGVIAVCPNDFQDNANHTTTVDLSASPVVPAGTVIGIGVEAPTALDAQNYVYVMSGFLSYERVE